MITYTEIGHSLHIRRALIHHLPEICLLRDLYLHTKAAMNGATR